jgi:hypothetical protein
VTDYRLKQNRMTYFSALYGCHLRHRVHPGLVYFYLPGLVERMRLCDEDALWLAFLNGVTQNPITTLRMFRELSSCPRPGQDISSFEAWFNENWTTLSFDTDRQKNKRLTLDAVRSYAALAEEAGSQKALYAGVSYATAWATAEKVVSFGRLSAFSYLEYVNLLGFGPASDSLFFEDLTGSRSHRNGMFFLHGYDHLVWDKRQPNGCSGRYQDLPALAGQMTLRSDAFLRDFAARHPDLTGVGYNTYESALCAFKNSFFGRRYAGVYADMGWDRVEWYRERGLAELTAPFEQMREEHLPDWLRIETEAKPIPWLQRATMFRDTGTPFRGQFFLPEGA